MRKLFRSLLKVGLVALAFFAAYPPNPAPADSYRPPTRTADELGLEVQTRGPVHEAFAQLTPTNPDAGPIIPKQPPPPVPEEPPEQKPASDQAQWIPGYWSWDAGQNDFVWVSGTWRAAPAERQWVPGHWAHADDGWQWVPGFWSETGQPQLDYVPEPPASLDRGPSAAAPNDNSFYVPGCWLPQNDRFVWRPGFWSACRPGRIWIPSRYSWTPGGYVFLNGYWDYPLENRGLLFAPVVFSRPLYNNPDWRYRPNYVVGLGPLLGSFFARPGWGSYYFGDYFGARYARLGFSPWTSYGPRFYDPLYRYYAWSHRGNPAWQRNFQNTYLARANGRSALPPRTLAAQNALFRSNTLGASANRANFQVVRPLGDVRGVRLASVSSPQRAAQQSALRNYQNLSAARGRIETPNRYTTAGPRGAPARSIASLRISNAPVHTMGRSSARTTNGGGAAVHYYNSRSTSHSGGVVIHNGIGHSGGVVIHNGTGRSGGVVIHNGTGGRTGFAATNRSFSGYHGGAGHRPAPAHRSTASHGGGHSSHGGGGGHQGGGGHKK